MKKLRLDIDYEYDFLLVGISCHEKPYRLCWGINRAMEVNLERADPFSIALKKNDAAAEFVLFAKENPENETALFLISNRSEEGVLIPEQHQADYFFIAHGPYSKTDHEKMISSLREVPFIIMSYKIDPATLKSKQNLLF